MHSALRRKTNYTGCAYYARERRVESESETCMFSSQRWADILGRAYYSLHLLIPSRSCDPNSHTDHLILPPSTTQISSFRCIHTLLPHTTTDTQEIIDSEVTA